MFDVENSIRFINFLGANIEIKESDVQLGPRYDLEMCLSPKNFQCADWPKSNINKDPIVEAFLTHSGAIVYQYAILSTWGHYYYKIYLMFRKIWFWKIQYAIWWPGV